MEAEGRMGFCAVRRRHDCRHGQHLRLPVVAYVIANGATITAIKVNGVTTGVITGPIRLGPASPREHLQRRYPGDRLDLRVASLPGRS